VQSLWDIEEDKIFRDRAPFHLVNGYDGRKSVASIFRVLYVKADCPEDGGRKILQDVDNRLRFDEILWPRRLESSLPLWESQTSHGSIIQRSMWAKESQNSVASTQAASLRLCRNVVCFRTAVVWSVMSAVKRFESVSCGALLPPPPLPGIFMVCIETVPPFLFTWILQLMCILKMANTSRTSAQWWFVSINWYSKSVRYQYGFQVIDLYRML
jgi:hypothetical protein